MVEYLSHGRGLIFISCEPYTYPVYILQNIDVFTVVL